MINFLRPKTDIYFQVALCGAYIRIVKICPPCVWKPESLVFLLSSSELCLPLLDCFEVALSVLGPDIIGGRTSDDSSSELLILTDKPVKNFRLGKKRPIEDVDGDKIKRQKVDGESVASEASIQLEQNCTHVLTFRREEDYANDMRTLLLSFVELLKPPTDKEEPLRPDLALSALSMLCIAFCRFPVTQLLISIFQQMCSWIPWILQQVLGLRVSF